MVYAAGDMMVVVKVQDSLRDMLMIIKLSDRGFTNVGKKCRKTSLVVVVNGQSTVAKRVPVLAKKILVFRLTGHKHKKSETV